MVNANFYTFHDTHSSKWWSTADLSLTLLRSVVHSNMHSNIHMQILHHTTMAM